MTTCWLRGQKWQKKHQTNERHQRGSLCVLETSVCPLADPSNHWALCFHLSSLQNGLLAGVAWQENTKLLFPEVFVHMTFFFFSWCNFFSACCESSFSPRPSSPVKSSKYRPAPSKLTSCVQQHLITSRRLFRLNPSFLRSALTETRGTRRFTRCLSGNGPALLYPLLIGPREWRCPPSPDASYSSQNNGADVHLNQDPKGSCASGSDRRRANCGDDLWRRRR